MPKTEFKPVKNIENDILKIIQKSIEEYIDGSVGENLSLKEFFNAGKTAKEIADHYQKFIEWFHSKCGMNRSLQVNDEPVQFRINPFDDFLTLDEVYNYYRDNVLKK